MKKILYTLSFLCILSAVSCTQELGGDDASVGQEAGTITLTLRTVEPQTKATKPGEAAYNENLIKSVHYFFYPKDGTDSNTEKEPKKRGQALNLNKQDQHILTVNASEDEIKNVLFKYPYNECDVYVIVNLPEDVDIDALPDRKLSTLKKIVLEDANFEANLTQPCFVMEGLDVATVIDRNKVLAARGTVPVDRVAAKISVSINVDERLDLQTPPDTPDNETSGMIWTSKPEKMTIEFVNGVNRTVLSGNPDDIELNKLDRFTDNQAGRTFASTTIDGEKFWTCAPFYSYPEKWEIGSDEEPYLFITLPWETVIWTSVGGQDPPIYREYKCYYKIMLASNELKRNTWYDLKINIGVLGSFENTPEVILPIEEIDYFVADWSEGQKVDSEILGARYLVVDKTTYEVYNQDEIRIPFTTSHICEIVDMSIDRTQNQATVIYPDYSKETANENREIDWNSSWYLAIDKNEIVLKHTLQNDISQDDFDYAPYTFKFTLRHTGIDENGKPYGDVYYKDITIVQYPAMVIQAQANRELQGTGGYGGTFVNGKQANCDYGGLYQLSGNPATKNPNMYVIKASVLPSTSNLIIGDPRSLEPGNLNNNGWATAPAIEGGANRKLLNYYRTLTTSDVKYMVAPKFRTASSHGVCNSELSYTNAEYRCASYQEDGYPAGRWRIPTLGEVQFMVTLSNEGVIPALYSSIAYWYAGGIVQNNGGSLTITEGTTNRNARVRCVYDEWYWENTGSNRLPGNDYAFTWGDAVR